MRNFISFSKYVAKYYKRKEHYPCDDGPSLRRNYGANRLLDVKLQNHHQSSSWNNLDHTDLQMAANLPQIWFVLVKTFRWYRKYYWEYRHYWRRMAIIFLLLTKGFQSLTNQIIRNLRVIFWSEVFLAVIWTNI